MRAVGSLSSRGHRGSAARIRKSNVFYWFYNVCASNPLYFSDGEGYAGGGSGRRPEAPSVSVSRDTPQQHPASYPPPGQLLPPPA